MPLSPSKGCTFAMQLTHHDGWQQQEGLTIWNDFVRFRKKPHTSKLNYEKILAISGHKWCSQNRFSILLLDDPIWSPRSTIFFTPKAKSCLEWAWRSGRGNIKMSWFIPTVNVARLWDSMGTYRAFNLFRGLLIIWYLKKKKTSFDPKWRNCKIEIHIQQENYPSLIFNFII